MIKKIDLGKNTLKFVVRHQWDGQIENDKFDKWSEKRLGIWWKTYKSSKYDTKFRTNFRKPQWDSIMIGFNLIWMNVWFDFGKKVKRRYNTKYLKRK